MWIKDSISVMVIQGVRNIFNKYNRKCFYYNSISDESNKANWKGVIFNGNGGKIYGNAVELTTSAEISCGRTLTVANGKTLSISKGVTLTNKGRIMNNGTIINDGIYEGTKCTLTGNPIIDSSTTRIS